MEGEAKICFAQEVYLLLDKNYRVSRNIRLRWFLDHLYKPLLYCKNNKSCDNERGMHVVSILPLLGDISSRESNLQLGPSTKVVFVSSAYRFVFGLDLSASVLRIDTLEHYVVIESMLTSLENCLTSLIQTYSPTSNFAFQPNIFVTIFIQWYGTEPTPSNNSQDKLMQKVLIQGCQLDQNAVCEIMQKVKDNVYACSCRNFSERMQSKEDDFLLGILRTGLLALRVLPPNRSSCIVILTDGVVGEPNAANLERVIKQCQGTTTSCSFIHVCSSANPLCDFGTISNVELLQFIAQSTKGKYINTLHIPSASVSTRRIYFQQALLPWTLHSKKLIPINQNSLAFVGSTRSCSAFDLRNVVAPDTECPIIIKQKQADRNVRGDFVTVVSARLREGFELKSTKISKNTIEMCLVLHWWKNGTDVEYKVSSSWPLSSNKCKVEVYICGTYEFLRDVSRSHESRQWTRFRKLIMHRFMIFFQDLMHTEHMLQYLYSFADDPSKYSISDSLRQGQTLYYLPPNSSQFELSTQSLHTSTAFSSYWKPILSLDVNVWHKWFHIHRIEVILQHDVPLPDGLHIVPSDGRYHAVQCRVAFSSLVSMLREWCTFVLLENHTYVKFIFSDINSEKPSSFFLVRLFSKSPATVLKIAFLSGLSGKVRKNYADELRDRVAALLISVSCLSSTSTNISSKRVRHSSKLSPILRSQRSQHSASDVPCAVLLHKPMDHFLVRYSHPPEDYHSYAIAREAKMKVNSDVNDQYVRMRDMQWYLHHHRSVWSLTNTTSTHLILDVAYHLASLLRKIRMEEGFRITYSASGVVNLAREFPMHSNAKDPENGAEYCLVQYVIFPPKVQITNCNNSSSSLESDDEGLNDEDDVICGKEIILATEVWIEPQHGHIKKNGPFSSSYSGHENSKSFAEFQNEFFNQVSHYGGLSCDELIKHINDHDYDCISNVITLEHLQLMCATENEMTSEFPQRSNADLLSGFAQSTPSGNSDNIAFANISNRWNRSTEYHYNSCVFDLISLLEHSPRVEHWFMTLKEDESCGSASNTILLENFHKCLAALCDCCVDLSIIDQQKITQHMEHKSRNVNSSDSSQQTLHEPWKCYLKSGENGQIFVLLLPSSYKSFLELAYLFTQPMSFSPAHDTTSSNLCENLKSEPDCQSETVPINSDKIIGHPSSRLNRRMSIKRLASTASNSSENLVEQPSKSITQRTISVFVYNCSMKMLVSSLIHGAKNMSRLRWPDSLQDHCVFVEVGSEDYFNSYPMQPTQCDFPKPTVSSHGLSDISEEPYPLKTTENEYLSQLNQTLVKLYYKSFVVGIFSAVQSEEKLFFSADDLQIATDYFCNESIDEIDITDFMFLNCPPVLEFRSKNLKAESHDDISDSLSSEETNADVVRQDSNASLRLSRPTKRKKVSSICATSSSNQQDKTQMEISGVTELESGVGGSNNYLHGPTPTIPGLSLHKQSAFTSVPVRSMSRKRNFCDSDHSVSSDEETCLINAVHVTNQDVDRKGSTFPAKQVIRSAQQISGLEAGWTNLPEFPTSMLHVSHSRHFSGTNEQVEKHFLKMLKAHCQSVRGVPYLFYAVNQQTFSHKFVPKGEVNKNESDSEVEFINCEGNNPTKQPVSANNSVDISGPFILPALKSTSPVMFDEDDSSDTFENLENINPLFLYMTCTIRDTRRGKVGIVPVKCLPISLKYVVNSLDPPSDFIDLEKIKITLDLIWIYLPSVSHKLSCAKVPDECSVFVQGIKHKIKWLLEDEIISCLRATEPITASTLDRVTHHIQLSSAFSNSKTSSAPLPFIFGIEKSKSLLQAEFEKKRISNYKLKKVQQYYFLSLERTFLPIQDYVNFRKSVSVEEEAEEVSQSPEIKHPSITSTSSCSPRSHQAKAMGDSQIPISNKTNFSTENYCVTSTAGSCTELSQQEKQTKKLAKASSSTELVLGSSTNFGRRCTSASNMQMTLKSPKDINLFISLPFSHEVDTCSVITPPPVMSHQSLHTSLSLGKETKYCTSSGKGQVVSMPVTPSNVNAEMPVFVYPVGKFDSRQNIGASPASDSSLRQVSQPSWLGSGYEGEDSDNSDDEICFRNSFQEVCSQLPNFWLIVHLKNDFATVYFHRRSSTKVVTAVKLEHERIFNLILTNLKKSCKAVNQILLLRKLHDSLWCHPLLVEEAPEHIWGKDDYSSIYRQTDSVEDQGLNDARKHNHGNDYLAAAMNFPPSHFECNCVLEQTIVLHHRITVWRAKQSSSSDTVPSALSTVKAFMKNFTVINQKNMFVFQVQDGTVYYCKMQEEIKRPDSCGRNSSLLADASSDQSAHFKDSIQRHQETDSKLFLKWYGVHSLTEQQLNDLHELRLGIEKKLDDTVLEYITMMLCRNTHFKLTAADVCLIQPRENDSSGVTVPIPPDETVSFAVASNFTTSMPALLYYIHQHLLLFLSIPRYASSSAVQFLPNSRNVQATGPCFDSSALYLYAESTEKGKKGHGVACICLDYSKQRYDSSGDTGNIESKISCKFLEKVAKVSTVNFGIQDKFQPVISFCIWTRGSLNSTALLEKLEVAVTHAVCDAVTELHLEMPITPRNDLKTAAMKSLFNPNDKEDSRFLHTFFQSKFGSGSARAAKKSVLNDDHANITCGTEMNQFYSMVLPNWLKHMVDLSCPSVFHCSIECKENLIKKQVVQNIFKILSSALRNSKLLMFCKPSDSNEKWCYTDSESSTDSCSPGNYMQYIVISRNFDLWKKSIKCSGSTLIKLHGSWVSVQKFLPHDITLKPEASPCPQHDMMLSSSYIPRQHFVYMTAIAKSIQVFFYNVTHDKAHSTFEQLKHCVKFQTARLNMLQGLTMQKLGLFKHYLTKAPTSSQNGTDLGSYSVDSLTKYSHLPSLEKKSKNFSYVDKYFDEFLLNFSHADDPATNKLLDKVTYYGQQCFARLQQKLTLKDGQNQLKNLRRKVSGSVCPITTSELTTILSYARLIHTETSPIMLDDTTRQNYLSFFEIPHFIKHKNDKALSRTSSFLESYRRRSGESLNKISDKDFSLSLTADGMNDFSEMSFNFVADKFVELYGDHWKSFVHLTTGRNLTTKSKAGECEELPKVVEHYRYRFLPGGIILVAFSVHRCYFQVKLYTIPSSSISDHLSQYSSKPHSNFVNECEKVKRALDVHRIALDVHLQYLHWYLNEPLSLVKTKCNLHDLLNSSVTIYASLLDNIQSQIYRGTVSHTCSQVSSQDLYRFIISNAAAFNFKTFVQKNCTGVNENVLFTDEKVDVHLEGCSTANHHNHRTCQVIFKDDEQDSNSLKFYYYLMFTCDRVLSQTTNLPKRLPKSLMQAGANLSRRLSEVSSPLTSGKFSQHSTQFPTVEEEMLEDTGSTYESVPMYVICEKLSVETRLRDLTYMATMECYRSCYLWQKLLQLCQEKNSGKALSYAEFCTLLDMMHSSSLVEYDDKILKLFKKRNAKQDGFILKRLLKQFPKMSTIVASPDNTLQHLCIVSPKNVHVMVVIKTNSIKHDFDITIVKPLTEHLIFHNDSPEEASNELSLKVCNAISTSVWMSWL